MSGRPAVFLDRDGTLIDEKVYLSDPDGVVLVPGAVDALRALREGGFVLVTVTNQSGVARGLYTEADYHAVANRLTEILAEHDVAVDETRFCFHHPDFTGPCECRKPGTGMYEASAARLGIDLERSFYVGDKITDVQPGITLGGQGILVRTGYGSELEGQAPNEVWVVDDVLAAAQRIRKASPL